MSFLNPFLLWGLGAATVPIVIHLLNRRRFQRQRWAAMEWLLRAAKKNKRRLQIENLLLLLLRTLAILFLALAISGPVLSSAAIPLTDTAGSHLYILLDNSASMSARAGTRTSFEDAVTTATSLLGEIGDNDPVTVVVTNDVPGSATTTGRPRIPEGLKETRQHPKVRSFLSELGVAPARADLVDSLKLLEDAVTETAMGRKKVAIISDLQEVTVSGVSARDDRRPQDLIKASLQRLEAAGADVVLMPAGRDSPNVAVTSIRPQDQRDIVQSSPAVFVVEVVNFGDRREKVEVRFLVDGEERGAQTAVWVDLPPRPAGPDRPPSTPVEFEIIFASGEAGAHSVEASVTADTMSMDDTRSYAFKVREPIKVLAVDGDPNPRNEVATAETYWLAGALALRDDGPIQVTKMDEADFERVDNLFAYDLVILANVRRPAPRDEIRERLEDYVSRGGALMLTVGDQVVADVWNAELYGEGLGLLPAKLGSTVSTPDTPARFDLRESKHPLMVNVTDPASAALFQSPEIFGYMQLENVEAQEGTRVLMTYTDLQRTPALVSRRVGRGQVLMLTTTVDEGWGRFPGSYLFPALLHESVYYMTSRGNADSNLECYEPYIRDYPDALQEFELTFPDASLAVDAQPEKLSADRPGKHLDFQQTEQRGVYRTLSTYQADDILGRRPPPSRDAFAVNMTALESDVRRIDPDEVRSRWGDHVRIATTFASMADAVAPDRGYLHKPLLLAALLCLLAEVFIARRIGARRTQVA